VWKLSYFGVTDAIEINASVLALRLIKQSLKNISLQFSFFIPCTKIYAISGKQFEEERGIAMVWNM
jgi:hypothetical protein